MIDDIELKRIINITSENPINDVEIIAVLERYIYDRKNSKVSIKRIDFGYISHEYINFLIKKGVNSFQAYPQATCFHMMSWMFDCARVYYNEKFKN